MNIDKRAPVLKVGEMDTLRDSSTLWGSFGEAQIEDGPSLLGEEEESGGGGANRRIFRGASDGSLTVV